MELSEKWDAVKLSEKVRRCETVRRSKMLWNCQKKWDPVKLAEKVRCCEIVTTIEGKFNYEKTHFNHRFTLHIFSVILLNFMRAKTSKQTPSFPVADLGGRSPACHTMVENFLNFMQFFLLENVATWHLGAPWRVGAPSYARRWWNGFEITPCPSMTYRWGWGWGVP